MLHVENEELNEQERENGVDVLESYPVFVGLNMTSTCNARCTFCSIQPKTQPVKDFISLDDIKEMTWLEHVRDFAIWCGIGDSLVNKEFLDCYRYIKKTFPHLNIDFSTNGIGMTEEIAGEFAGHLSAYNVSLNATTEAEWSSMMRTPKEKFENVCKSYKHLSDLRKTIGSDKPVLKLSMVITRDNIGSAPRFVELAHILGADQVTFVHFVTSTLVGRRDLNKEQSLYYDQTRCDDELAFAEARAKALGIHVIRPRPFSEPFEIDHGTRVEAAGEYCVDPWRTCYLTVDEDGNRQMIFCCSGFYYSAKYDKSALTPEYFRKIWNHPAATYFRRTVNGGTNPICGFCQTHDHFDPEDNTIFGVGKAIKPVFDDLNVQYQQPDQCKLLLEDMVEFV